VETPCGLLAVRGSWNWRQKEANTDEPQTAINKRVVTESLTLAWDWQGRGAPKNQEKERFYNWKKNHVICSLKK
jgi:hypothetical protein